MSVDLHVESAGQGPSLVLIHGWGLHGGIWSDLVPRLSRHYRVICPDLPGHGASPRVPDLDLDKLVELVAFNAPRKAAYLGWSLGGIIAMELARRLPQRVERLVLMATTPRFLDGPGWPCGVAADVLDSFATGLAADYRKTVRDFLTLQVRGDSHGVELLRTLRRVVFAHGEPDPQALSDCLKVLARTDLRDRLAGLDQPALIVAGEHDRLCPADASHRLARMLAKAELEVIAGAGHAPFLSHRRAVLDCVQRFLRAGVSAPHAPA